MKLLVEGDLTFTMGALVILHRMVIEVINESLNRETI